MNDEQLDQRLALLEMRLRRIEELLQLALPAVVPEQVVPSDSRAFVFQPEPDAAPAAAPAQPPPLPPSVSLPPRRMPEHLSHAPAADVSPARAKIGFEQTLGLKWAGWIGAIVLIIGAALGVRYAYEQGWLEAMSPIVRLGLIAAGGVALLGAGEWVYRRIDRIPGASLMGAGVATLFLASYAGNAYYKLYDPGMALVFTAAVTLAGAAVSRRGNLVAIAVLSLIGGNLIPMLLTTAHPKLAPFLCYLLMLQCVALSLAYMGASAKWWILRLLSLAGTAFWMMTVLLNREYAGEILVLLSFSALFAAAFQGELIASSFKARAGKTSQQIWVNFSVIVSALLTVAMLWILRNESTGARTLAVAILAAVCALAAMAMRREAREMAFGFAMQAAALLVVIAPVALSGLWVIAAWGLLAVAYGAVGAKFNQNSSRYAATGIWVLAALDVLWHLVLENEAPARAVPWIHVLGQGITPLLTIGWIIALLGQLVAWLGVSRTPSTEQRQTAWYLSAGTIGLWIIVSMAVLPPQGATLSLVVLAWILALGDIASRKIQWAIQAGAVLLFASVKWIVLDILAERFSPDWPAALSPIFNSTMGMTALLPVSLLAIYWLRGASIREVLGGVPGDRREVGLIFALWCAVITIMTAGLSVQIDLAAGRAAQSGTLAWPRDQFEMLMLTILWTASAMGYWLTGLWADRKEAGASRGRKLQWLMIVLALKYLLADAICWHLDRAAADVMVLFNLQTLAGVVVIAAIVVQLRMTKGAVMPARRAGALAIVVILLCIGTLEIDRAFQYVLRADFSKPERAKQVAISIFWSLFAIGCVFAGFRGRSAGLRLLGLGLFGVTLLKVVLIDLAQVGAGYRILSFLGLGLLMLGTSVLYGKLSPRLLAQGNAPAE